MTLGQGHGTPLGHGQQLCEILSRSNMAVKSYGPDTHILLCVHFDLDLGGMTLGQGHDTSLGHGQQLCEVLSRSNMAVRSYGPDIDFVYKCTVTLPWPWRYDLGSRSWHTLESWTTIVWNIIQIKHGSEELWPGHTYFAMCALWPWPWRNYLGSRSWHILGSWTIIGQGVKKLWPGHDVNRRTDRQTDRQTGWFLYNPPNFVCGGYNTPPPPNFVCRGYNSGNQCETKNQTCDKKKKTCLTTSPQL